MGQVFKPLYYWDGGRDALMQSPHKVQPKP